MKILILASNPRKDLNLDREIRDLKRAIESSRNQQEFEVVDELAVRVGDLQELLFKHQPQIVHFCGHGGGEQGLVFASDAGREHLVRTEALSNLFRLFSSSVECVLLNACYSEEQAGAIVDHINYVIGMNQEIRDDAAIAFSKGFYRALGYACSIEQSYEFGCNAIQLEISGSSVVRSAVSETERKLGVADAVAKIAIPEHQKPILKKKPTLTPNLSASIPSPNQTLSQEKRTEIQLDIDKSLEADSKIKQYRECVQEFLGDRKLMEFEKIRLEQLRKDLGLSESNANKILEEEQALIRKSQNQSTNPRIEPMSNSESTKTDSRSGGIYFGNNATVQGDVIARDKVTNTTLTLTSEDASSQKQVFSKEGILKLLAELKASIKEASIDEDDKDVAVGQIATAISEAKKTEMKNYQEAKDKLGNYLEATKAILDRVKDIGEIGGKALPLLGKIANLLGLSLI